MSEATTAAPSRPAAMSIEQDPQDVAIDRVAYPDPDDPPTALDARQLAALAVQLPGGEEALVEPIGLIDGLCDRLRLSDDARAMLIWWAVLGWFLRQEADPVSQAELRQLGY